MGKKSSGTRCQQLLSLRQRLHWLFFPCPANPSASSTAPLDPWTPLQLTGKSLCCSWGAQGPHTPPPLCLVFKSSPNHPAHTSRMRTCERSQSPTGGLHKGRMEHHNARIQQQQQNSIEASQHKNPHCMFDFQPSQLWAAENYRIYHSLLPNPALAFLF